MADKRITVWVQRFKDRPTLQLQWIDPVTNRRKTRSAETSDEGEAEQKRKDLGLTTPTWMTPSNRPSKPATVTLRVTPPPSQAPPLERAKTQLDKRLRV